MLFIDLPQQSEWLALLIIEQAKVPFMVRRTVGWHAKHPVSQKYNVAATLLRRCSDVVICYYHVSATFLIRENGELIAMNTLIYIL